MNKELKEICSKCEDYIHCQDKGCAWRSLGNEYCDEVENVNKLINDLQQENKKLKIQVSSREEVANKYKEVIDKAINNSQYWIDYYTRLNSDERIALRLQENIDILKEVSK